MFWTSQVLVISLSHVMCAETLSFEFSAVHVL